MSYTDIRLKRTEFCILIVCVFSKGCPFSERALFVHVCRMTYDFRHWKALVFPERLRYRDQSRLIIDVPCLFQFCQMEGQIYACLSYDCKLNHAVKPLSDVSFAQKYVTFSASHLSLGLKLILAFPLTRPTLLFRFDHAICVAILKKKKKKKKV